MWDVLGVVLQVNVGEGEGDSVRETDAEQVGLAVGVPVGDNVADDV